MQSEIHRQPYFICSFRVLAVRPLGGRVGLSRLCIFCQRELGKPLEETDEEK